MGQYTFDNLKGFEDFSKKAKKGDIVVAGKNFGSGSSRQQAVDCFLSLGIQAIIAESFGAIYERNAINAAFPVITCKSLNNLDLNDGDMIKVDLKTGEITNLRNNQTAKAEPFSEVQYEIYQKGGFLAIENSIPPFSAEAFIAITYINLKMTTIYEAHNICRKDIRGSGRCNSFCKARYYSYPR